MKKIKYVISLLLIFTMSFVCFAGCTKAGNADLSQTLSHYEEGVFQYCYTTQDGSYGIVTDNGKTFKFKTSSNISQKLIEKEDKDHTKFNILKNSNEYSFMLEQATTYFYDEINALKPILSLKENSKLISKNLTKELWYNIDALNASIKKFNEKHQQLIVFVEHSSIDESDSNVAKLSNLLTEYKNVISKLITASITTEKICDCYISTLHDDYDTMTEVQSLELDQMIQMYRLYVTNYLFQRYMTMSDDNFLRFKDSDLYVKLDQVSQAYATAKQGNNIPQIVNNTEVLDIYRILKQNAELLKVEATENKNIVNYLTNFATKLEIKYSNFSNLASQIKSGKKLEDVSSFKDANETDEEFANRYLLTKNFYVDYNAKLCSYMNLLDTLITKASNK